jgi:hypothetical protein
VKRCNIAAVLNESREYKGGQQTYAGSNFIRHRCSHGIDIEDL